MADEQARDRIVAWMVGVGRSLRVHGVQAGPDRIQDALRALSSVPLSSREQVYWALRCTLVSRQEEIRAFDEAFAGLSTPGEPGDELLRPGASGQPQPGRGSAQTAEQSAGGERESQGEREDQEELEEAGIRFSAVERLRELDFRRYSEPELRVLSALIERVVGAMPLRRSRRLRRGEQGQVFDKRRTLREAMRTDGYPVVRSWRERRLLPRKLVFVADISGSMQPYARALVIFLQAVVRGGRTVEAFTFGTRLTRITEELEIRDPDAALRAATRVVQDWAGGTRIGDNLRALNEQWGCRGLLRGSIVVILSDGWERGDISSLVDAMCRLHRAAHTVVWVNPLAGEPGYEPLAQGMAAALPYVDSFLPGHNLRSLQALAQVLEAIPVRGARHQRIAIGRSPVH